MTDAASNQAALNEVLELEDRRWSAIIAKDTDALADLFAAEMSYTHSNAVVDTRSSYLEAIEKRAFDYHGVERHDTTAHLVGDTALLTGRAEIDVTASGRDVHLNARYTVVWVRRDGRWQFLCWQSTSIPA